MQDKILFPVLEATVQLRFRSVIHRTGLDFVTIAGNSPQNAKSQELFNSSCALYNVGSNTFTFLYL